MLTKPRGPALCLIVAFCSLGLAASRAGAETSAKKAPVYHVALPINAQGRTPPAALKKANKLNASGQTAEEAGNYRSAEAAFEQEYKLRVRLQGSRHTDTLYALYCLASATSAQGQHAKAEKLFRQLSDFEVQAKGSDGDNTLAALSHLASEIFSQNRFAEAEDIDRRIYEVLVHVNGADDIETVLALNNLAQDIDQEGRHDEASKLYARVLNARVQVLERRELEFIGPSTSGGFRSTSRVLGTTSHSAFGGGATGGSQTNFGSSSHFGVDGGTTSARSGPTPRIGLSDLLNGVIMGAVVTGLNSQPADAPFLPWPPLAPSSRGDITDLVGLGSTFGQADAHIRKVLQQSGYPGPSYFSVPGGFAILAALEHTGPQGEILSGSDRWSLAKETAHWSWSDYMTKLFSGQDGRYRMFLFIVTARYYGTAEDVPNGQDVERWLHTGRDSLDPWLARQYLENGTTIHLFVYEFSMDKGRLAKTADRTQGLLENTSESLPFETHLKALKF